MVNAAKRMRGLAEKLYHIRNGPGSVELPPQPAPQIKDIYMRLPTGEYRCEEYYIGAREFWHTIVRRLKYYNPSLPVKVDFVRAGQNEPLYMTVTYETPEKKFLEKNIKMPRPLFRIPQPPKKIQEQLKLQRQQQQRQPDTDPETRTNNERRQPTFEEQMDLDGKDGKRRQRQVSKIPAVTIPPHIAAVAPKDEITLVPQPATDPAAPQTTSPPQPVYSRTLTLPLAGLRHHEIYWWFKQPLKASGLFRYGARRTPLEEKMEISKLQAFKKRAQMDRIRVKKGVEAMKREEAELKKARESAAAMTAEA